MTILYKSRNLPKNTRTIWEEIGGSCTILYDEMMRFLLAFFQISYCITLRIITLLKVYVVVCVLLVSSNMLYMANAFANLQQFTLLKKFGDWEVVLTVNTEKKRCHAISYPIEHKIYKGDGGVPFLVISHMGHNAFSVNLNAGITLAARNGLQFIANGRSYGLKVRENIATSYSATQDVNIINDIIMEDMALMVRVIGKDEDIVIDYYSIRGLKKALLYMDNYCFTRYNYDR